MINFSKKALKLFAQVPILRMTSLIRWFDTEPDSRQRTRK